VEGRQPFQGSRRLLRGGVCAGIVHSVNK